jgi:hypothetical protein
MAKCAILRAGNSKNPYFSHFNTYHKKVKSYIHFLVYPVIFQKVMGRAKYGKSAGLDNLFLDFAHEYLVR